MSIAHLATPSTLMSMHFSNIKQKLWSHDVDIFYGKDQDFMTKLSYKSRVPIKRIQECTLVSYTGYLAEVIHENTTNKLISPLVKRGRISNNKGLRFCPKCLKEDTIPYFRKKWRLSFVTTCQKHRCFLKDACPQCNKPITLYTVKKTDDLCKCHYCGNSLLSCTLKYIPKNSRGQDAQSVLVKILEEGTFSFEQNLYYSIFYFMVLNQICKLIYNYSFHKEALSKESYSKKINIPIFAKKPLTQVESLSLEEQYVIYSVSEWVLSSSSNFNLFCKTNSIGRSELTHSMKYVPFWYQQLVDQNTHKNYILSIKEVESAIQYLIKHHKVPSMNSIATLFGYRLEKRHRMDIYNLLKSYKI